MSNQEDEIPGIINSYLQLSSESEFDVASTAQKLSAIYHELVLESKDQDEPPEPWVLYDRILRCIEATTHDSPTQDKLVRLLGALKATRPEPKENYWSSLYPLGLETRELWNDKHSATVWASLNAFTARLTSSEVLDFKVYGIWAMRYSLEDDYHDLEDVGQVNPGELNPAALDVQIPAAAVWIFYFGQKIWDLCMTNVHEHDRAAMGGPKWEGKGGYNQPRWVFWKMRLERFAERKDLAEETVKIAKKALKDMNKIDGTGTDSV